MTPTLYDEAITFFRKRERSAHAAYQERIKDMVDDFDLEIWHDAADSRGAWLNTHNAAVTAFNATPCQHTTAERSHEAQRCACCWIISTYIRLTTKENDDE